MITNSWWHIGLEDDIKIHDGLQIEALANTKSLQRSCKVFAKSGSLQSLSHLNQVHHTTVTLK